MYTFTSSRLSADNNLLFPDRLEIYDDKIMFYKGAAVGYQSMSVPKFQISSVSIHSGLLFADVVIESSGGRRIVIHGLSKSDAKDIYYILNS